MRFIVQVPLAGIIALSFVVGNYAIAQSQDSGLTITSDLDGTSLNQIVAGGIHVQGKIDGGSNVSLTSTNGSITIDGKVDGGSFATLNAAGDIRIGVVGGDGDKKIDGGSSVTAISGGTISLGNKIDGCPGPLAVGSCSSVSFKAANGIDIGNKIDSGVQVWLCTANGSIHVHDKIDNGNTNVRYWPSGSLIVDGGIHGGAHVNADQSACQHRF